MADESRKDVGDIDATLSSTNDELKVKKKKKRGLISRIWNGIFRSHGDDFEKRLQYISKEEAAVLARIKKRTQNSRRMTRHLIILSLLIEVIAVIYAIITTRTVELNWKMRALRVLPMFLLPGLSFCTYSAVGSFIKMCDRKDQKTLERLRAERQAKIDELKEKTNYYITQQLIQRYDPDPAAKAAAATVLASKLGADSGLKVYVGDESKENAPTGKSNDVQLAQSSGLRQRKQAPSKSGSLERSVLDHPEDGTFPGNAVIEELDKLQRQQMVVEHYQASGSSASDGGWISRIAALLVGEDPTQSYALICGNCRMHNGLVSKEDFPYVTYYCPHCNALNRPKHLKEHGSGSSTPNVGSSITASDLEVIKNATIPVVDKASDNGSPLAAPLEAESDQIVPASSSS